VDHEAAALRLLDGALLHARVAGVPDLQFVLVKKSVKQKSPGAAAWQLAPRPGVYSLASVHLDPVHVLPHDAAPLALHGRLPHEQEAAAARVDHVAVAHLRDTRGFRTPSSFRDGRCAVGFEQRQRVTSQSRTSTFAPPVATSPASSDSIIETCSRRCQQKTAMRNALRNFPGVASVKFYVQALKVLRRKSRKRDFLLRRTRSISPPDEPQALMHASLQFRTYTRAIGAQRCSVQSSHPPFVTA
jgi:hypothetical protein